MLFQCVRFVLRMFHFLVKQLLDRSIDEAKNTLEKVKEKYPIVITRDLGKARKWLKQQARGTERYGIVVSSQAETIKTSCNIYKSTNESCYIGFLKRKDDIRFIPFRRCGY